MPRLVSTPGSGSAAVITLAATEGVTHGVLSILGSYSGQTASGSLTIAVGGTTIINVDISGQAPFLFEEDITGGVGESVVITLSGVLLSSAKLNVNYTSYM